MGTEGAPAPGSRKSILRLAGKHLSREWPSALFVASLVTIASLHFNWLKVFEAYTYVAIGHMTSIGAAVRGAPPRAAVVIIDQRSHELVYGEVSPLNRCILRDHLASIYDAQPDVVVVDLDLSPSPGVPKREVDRNRNCDEELLELITSAATAHCPIKTVLLKPFDADSPTLRRVRSDWQARLVREGKGGVRFASGELPVNYGVHVSPSERADSIARVAMELSRRHVHHTEKLDTRQLLTGLLILSTSKFEKAELTRALREHLPGMAAANPGGSRVVFFGGAYGADDLFLSVVGEIWGVEAHAAAYVGERIDEHHFVDLVIDVAIALIFSLAIAFFWHHYFNARLHERPVVRELAKLLIVALMGSVLLLVLGLSLGSYWLLLNYGLWLSPVPIAIGMLIDSFVSGSVDQATHKFAEMRKQLLEQRRQLSTPPATEEIARASIPHVARPRTAWCARNLPWALGGEICDLLADRKRVAAILLLLWTLTWLSTALFAVKLTLNA